MRKIGIVGGIGWPSTVDYYTELSRRADAWRRSPKSGPCAGLEMSIESLDLNRAASFIGEDGDEPSWFRFDEYHRSALDRLESRGAELALMASNTSHHRFAAVVRGIRIPVVNMFEAVAAEAARIRARHVAILGTAVTMRSEVLREAFSRYGVEAAGPRDEETRASAAELIESLQAGDNAGAAARLGKIARAAFLQQFMGRPVVCLACTELPLAFPDRAASTTFEFEDVTYINSSAAHIAAAFELARAES